MYILTSVLLSVTENEVRHGIIEAKTNPKDSVIAIVRNIPDIKAYLGHEQAPRFADTLPSQAKIDEEASTHLAELRDKHLQEKIPEENVTRVEIEWLACGANLSMDTVKDAAVAKFAQKFVKGREINVTKHKNYLKNMCREFQKRIIDLINQGGERNMKSYDNLTTELLQHQHLARTRCEVFEGRTDVIRNVLNYIKDKSDVPLVIYGHSGCGKTSVISRIYEILCEKSNMPMESENSDIPNKHTEVVAGGENDGAPPETTNDMKADPDTTNKENSQLKPGPEQANDAKKKKKKAKDILEQKPPVVLLRFLGTTPLTSTIQQVLVTACGQIARLYDVAWDEPEKFTNLSRSFKNILKCATKERPLVLLIDSIDQLMPVYGAYKVDWLPKTLPPYVKVILSTLVEGYPIFENLTKRYGESGSKFIEILPLGDEIGMTIIRRWLENSKRTLTGQQEAFVRRALEVCSLPLYARITYSHVMRWPSYYEPDNASLAHTVQEAIATMFQQMEAKLGGPLVKHSLALLTASRYGLSEVELEHALSLDDVFLGHIYKFWRPPIRRVPPLLWTRVRNEISNYIVERSVDGILVLYWYHRQFIAATKARYLSDPIFLSHVHTILGEYFLGKWGNGRAKPFEYTEHQKKRFALDTTKSAEDRKVPSQPFFYESFADGQSSVRFNQRKVSELPLHLFKSRQQDLLLKEVFFNYQWIYAKVKSTSPRALLQEFELFMLSDKKLMNNFELKLLVANLQMIRPFMAKLPDCLSVELTGRLAKYVGNQPSITALIKQCDSIGAQHCPLLPVTTCYETADVGLKQSMHIRDTESWHEGGAITCSKDFKTLFLVDYDIEGVSYLSQWDIKSGDKISERMIDKQRDQNVQESDVYFHILLDKSEKVLIAFYKKRYYEGGLDKKYGYIDMVKIDTCAVDRTYSCPLQKKDFYNSLHFITENWVCARFGRKIPMFSIHGKEAEIPLKTPNYITQNEEYQVTIHPKLPNITMQDDKPVRLENTRQRMGSIKEFKTMKHLADMERSEESVGVGIAHGDRTVALIDLQGNVVIHDIEHVRHPRKVKKVKRSLALPTAEHVNSIDIHEGEVFDAYHQTVVEAKVIFSPNDKFMISLYQSAWRSKWEAFLWNLSTLKYVRRLANNRSTKLRAPVFTADSNFVVLTSLDMKQLRLIHSESGQLVKTYDIGHVIRDFTVSPKSTEIALLLQKDVMFVDANPAEMGNLTQKQGTNSTGEMDDDVELLPRESITNHDVHPRLVIRNGRTVEEPGVLQRYADRGQSRKGSAGSRAGSASSIRHLAVDTWESPDGEKLFQLHSRAQVIDTKEEVIKYTPRSEDIVVRGKAEEDNIQEDWDAFTGIIDLAPKDKIVGIGNKTKLKVTSEDPGRMKIMCVPSVIRVSVMETQLAKQKKRGAAAAVDAEVAKPKEKLRRLEKITVYQENIATVSNNFIVTVKRMSTGEFVHVYELLTGKYTTYPVPSGGFGCARLSLDEKRVFVASKERLLKVYPATTSDLSPPITIEPDKISRHKCLIHDILTFPDNPYCVVMRYAKEGPEAHFTSSYRYVSIEEKAMSKPLVVTPALEDITRDGSVGISNELRIYNLITGHEEKRIPYGSDSQLHVQARISDDKARVVFVDFTDDTLHVYKISGDSPVLVSTCFTHSPQWSSTQAIRLRQNGSVIIIRGSITGVFVIRNQREAGQKLNRAIDYASGVFRGRALMRGYNAIAKPQINREQMVRALVNSTTPLPPITQAKSPKRAIKAKESIPSKTSVINTDLTVLEKGTSATPVLPPIEPTKSN